MGSKPRKKTQPSQSAPKAGLLASPTQQTYLCALLIVIVTVALYFPVSRHPFVNYDDGFYVINNDHIKHGLGWETITWSFTSFDLANWHPLTWLSLALDWQLFGFSPGGPHIVNLLLHVANALVLFWVLLRATGFVGRSFMVATLFAVHPINVETVAWIAERKNVLSMLFFLLALEAYRRYVAQPHTGRYAMVTLLYALGLMAKPQVITLPFVLLLWDYWPLQRISTDGERKLSATAEAQARSFSFLIKEKLPLFAVCAASAVITVIAQRAGGGMNEVYYQPLPVRVENATVAYVRYLQKAFWPSGLAPLYPHPGSSLPLWQALAAFVLLAAITFLVMAARHRRYLVVGWFWFLGTLVPMIGLVQVGGQAMADRYAYLPLIGVFIMVCWGVADWAKQRKLSTALLAGASALVLLALSVVTHHQLAYWADNISLWSHTIEVTLPNYIAEDNLGTQLRDQGQTEEAMKHFRSAAAIYPDDPTSNLLIAMYEQQHGHLAEVVEQYKKLLKTAGTPQDKAEMLTNQGFAYGGLRDYQHARECFQAAVALDPRKAKAWMGLGVMAQRAGDLGQAIEAYTHSVNSRPTDVAYVLLAGALAQSGRNTEAQAAMQQARLLSQNLDGARHVADGLLAP